MQEHGCTMDEVRTLLHGGHGMYTVAAPRREGDRDGGFAGYVSGSFLTSVNRDGFRHGHVYKYRCQ